MPHRLNEFRAKIQFVTSAEMPSLIYKACVATGARSNTVYIQMAVARALSRDLGIPMEEIVRNLPKPHGNAATRFDGGRRPVRPGSAGTIEEVR